MNDAAAHALIDVEIESRRKLEKIKEKYRVVRPKGMAIGKQLQFDWEAYLQEQEKLETNLFQPAAKKIDDLARDIAQKYQISVDRRRKLECALNEATAQAKKTLFTQTRETKEILDNVSTNVSNLTHQILVEMDTEIKQLTSEVSKIDVSAMDDSSLISERMKLESEIVSDVEKYKKLLENIQTQLQEVTWTRNESGEFITTSDISEAIEEENISLRERADLDLELSQLGTAVAIIHHEFDATIKSIRQSIRELKAWADLNDDLIPVYNNIRHNFHHLDGYLTLFTPLNKRLYRTAIEIHGSEIAKYIEDIFSERMRRHDIKLSVTGKFNKKTVVGYPSTFFPVFVNLIDNAIFWLNDISTEKTILLDANEFGFSISNNGPSISTKDREIIFEYGFSRKPNGRGLGLFISRQVLAKENYKIFVADPEDHMTVTFRIEPGMTQEQKPEVGA